MNKQDLKALGWAFAQFFIGVALALLGAAAVFTDAKYFNVLYGISVVESFQTLCLFVSIVCLLISARRKDAPGLILVAGFLGCMFIREQDGLFDLLAHGSWKYFALTCAALSIYAAWRAGVDKSLSTLVRFCQSREFYFIMTGLLTVLVFSRIMGMNALWKIVMADAYDYTVKFTIEEALELWGYILIMYSAVSERLSR